MTKRFKWLTFAISLGVVVSMALIGLSTGVNAAAPSKSRVATTHATKKATAKANAKASAASKCKTRVKAKGTVKWSDWQFPDTFSPYTGGNLAVTALNTNFTTDGLLGYNNKVKLFADMLARIPTLKNGDIQNGGKTITLHLRSGMKWSNGKPITSKDVKFSWQVNMDKLTGPYCAGTCDAIASIATPNATTDVLHMKTVYSAAIPYALEFPVMPAVYPGAWNNNAHAAAQKQEDPTFNYESSSYITNGPYQVGEYVKDDRIVYHPMKYYTILSCGGAIQTVIFAFYSDKNAMIAGAASRATDMTQDYTVADLTQLNAHKSAYKLYSDPGFFFEH
ncbi:MAG TPA: ABC transporter substrate-binding protein, partial [Chloroflexota bacterium]